MSLVIFLKCTATDCATLLPLEAQTVGDARNEGRLAGWATRTFYPDSGGARVEDRCPTHAHQLPHDGNTPSVVTDRIPPEQCKNLQPGAAQPCLSRLPRWDHEGKEPTEADPAETAVWDWCGHDTLGHRMANILCREGYTTVDKVLAASLPQVLELRGFGKLAVTRWEQFKENHAAS